MQKMLNKKAEKEKQIYTFMPKTDDNRLNIIKYDYNTINNIGNLNNTQKSEKNKKRTVDIQRIHDLYMDYKDKQNKIDILTKEYYKEAGFSFSPCIKDKNKEIKKFKNRIGQMSYMDRVEIYNNINKNKYKDNNLLYYTTDE